MPVHKSLITDEGCVMSNSCALVHAQLRGKSLIDLTTAARSPSPSKRVVARPCSLGGDRDSSKLDVVRWLLQTLRTPVLQLFCVRKSDRNAMSAPCVTCGYVETLGVPVATSQTPDGGASRGWYHH